MARQAGYYEWDDDLTPGKKKEGGWHQNLYDTEGQLKGSARFVPVDDDQEDPIVVTETMYVPADERLSKTQEMVTDIKLHPSLSNSSKTAQRQLHRVLNGGGMKPPYRSPKRKQTAGNATTPHAIPRRSHKASKV